MGRMRRGHSTGTEEAPTHGRWSRRAGHSTAHLRPRRSSILLVVAPLLVALAACSGDDDPRAAADERETTTTGETTTTLSAREQEEQAVIAAHEAASQARADSAANPDPANPVIPQTHSGLMLDRWRETLTGLQNNGFAIRYPPNSQYRTEVESVTFDEANGQEVAYLQVCSVDDGERYGQTSGVVLSSGLRTVQLTEAMVKEDGVWKVAELQENHRWDGVAGCAVV